MGIKAVIFDLDGVIVSTDEYHYRAWKAMADEEGIYFDKRINERLRGVSRMESLEIILEKAKKTYNTKEKIQMTERKNFIYRELLNELTPKHILKGVMNVLETLRAKNIKIAIGSSSKNTSIILEKIKLDKYFDAVADGREIKKSKPDPEVFLLAAKKLKVSPEECLIVEDADAGVEAAIAGGMKVLAVGYASNNIKANYKFKDLSCVDIKEVICK
ncbi:beta-phosphoglucomutase [Clostridium acetobutylicum]|nr:beta-phosphoglucomutase [Clostridium acetobutylicum]